MKGEPSDEQQRLNEENSKLRRQVRRYQWLMGRQWWAGKFVGRLFVGSSLASSVQAWFDALKSGKGRFPVTETSNVIVAFLRRMSRAAFFGALIAAVPAALFLWQNLLIRDQNRYFREQNTNLFAQVELQRTQYNNQRRTELTEILFEPSQRTWTNLNGAVVSSIGSRVDHRTRTEALIEFVAMERSRGAGPDLGGAILPSLELVGLNLSGGKFDARTRLSHRWDGPETNFVSDAVTFRECVFSDFHFDRVDLSACQIENSIFSYASELPPYMTGRRTLPIYNASEWITGRFDSFKMGGCVFSNVTIHALSASRAMINKTSFRDCTVEGNFIGAGFFGCEFVEVRINVSTDWGRSGKETESPQPVTFGSHVVFQLCKFQISEIGPNEWNLSRAGFVECDLRGVALSCKPLFATAELIDCQLPAGW